MLFVGQHVHQVGTNFVHLVVASTLAWGFVAGQMAVWGVRRVKGVRR